MEQTKQIKQFQFHDFYAEILNGLNDEEAGRMARLICEYMFTDNIVIDVKDDKERFYWGNIVDVLSESKEREIKGKQSSGLNRKMKHFTFQDNFYDAIKLLDDKQSGQYIKAICGYMFDNKTPTLKPPLDAFFTLAKRKLDLSKTRKRIGSKGGKTERIPVTTEQVKAADTMRGQSIGMDGFLKRNPHVKNDIYKSSMHLTSCIDWTTLDCELPYSEYRDNTSLYQILTHYINQRLNENNLKPRKDAVLMCSFVIGSDGEFFKSLTEDEERIFFYDATIYFANKYGRENIISAVVHKDETNPHLHLNLIPLDGERLCAKDLFCLENLRALQTELYEKVGKKYGLERGKKGSQAKHLSTAEFKAKKIIEQAEGIKEEVKEYADALKAAYNGEFPKNKNKLKEQVIALVADNEIRRILLKYFYNYQVKTHFFQKKISACSPHDKQAVNHHGSIRYILNHQFYCKFFPSYHR